MKRKLKWVPVPRYHISAAEDWLGKMAAKGLLFQYLWGPFAQFEVSGQKPGRRYRLAVAPSRTGAPDDKMEDLYQQFGWHFVASIWRSVFLVFYSDDIQAIEPFTDEQSRAATLPPLVKLCRRELIWACFWLVYILWMADQLDFGGVLNALAMSPLFLVLIGVLQIATTLLEFRGAAQLKKLLENGHELTEFKPPRIQKALKTAGDALAAGIIVFCCLTFLFQGHIPTRPLEEIPAQLDLLLLSDMAGPGYVPAPCKKAFSDPNLYLEFTESSDTDNHFQLQWLPLAPRHYAIEQTGKATDGTRLWLSIHRYDMRSTRLADPALAELIGTAAYREIDVPGADHFLVAEDGTVCAALDRRVIRVACYNWMDLEPWYGEIVQMLQASQ